MILISLPTIADFVAEKFGLYLDIPTLRFFTGIFFGVAVIYFILYSLLDIKKTNLPRQEI